MTLTHRFSVVPQLPSALEPLREVAYNLWWAWNPDAIELFRSLDPDRWEACGHSPVAMLQQVPQRRLLAAAKEPGYVAQVQAVHEKLQTYLNKPDRWFRTNFPDETQALVAYFSAEFGFHESLQIYSGGLGILAGDHCKSASDLGVPFVAVGLMYRQGYFTQHLNGEGWQESEYVNWNFGGLPVLELRHADGTAVRVTVRLPGRDVHIRVWEARVGRARIYLLDTDLQENTEEDRHITHRLYGGDHEMRIRQEIVLGIGGKRMIDAIGLRPTVFHMNEGHAAFLALERIRRRVQNDGISPYDALQVVAASTLFTTHTPVPAGNDAFSIDLMRRYFSDFVAEMGVSFDEFLKFGRPWHNPEHEPFSMTILALRLSRYANGVSRIHGNVSRSMWREIWPGVPDSEIPIGHITNGIHTQTWISPKIKELLQPYVGDIWEHNLSDPAAWAPVEQIPDEQLWTVHQEEKAKLVEFARANARRQRLRVHASAEAIREAGQLLDPRALTIGFARRFATYKRAGLLLRDPERLARICNHSDRPVQFVFAGKAHPADEGGKRLIQQVYHATMNPALRGRIVFLENYDMDVARHLYHGVDVWLNNPTRPLEASGTSGEKVCPNGVINCSVLDGWWAEAWQRGCNGWSIGEELTTHDPKVQDDFDADSLYNLIENEIAPLYYDCENGLPRRWVQKMKHSMTTVSPVYSTFRQVQDYTRNYYMPASAMGGRMAHDSYAGARGLAEWKRRIRENWSRVKVGAVSSKAPAHRSLTVGEEFVVEAQVDLGALKPEDVVVEAFVVAPTREEPELHQLSPAEKGLYRGVIQARDSGEHQFNIRVLPHHPLLVQKHELRLITWA
jgi:starch phosphorylase